GVSAYAMHRFWVGLCLGAVVVMWTTLALWSTAPDAAATQMPQYTGANALPQYICSAWSEMPSTVQGYLPLVGGIVMIAALLAALIWPRLGTALLWSAVGASLLVGMGTLAVWQLSPAWVAALPRQISSQLAMLGIVVLIGATWQWYLLG